MKAVRREIDILKSIQHPGIAGYLDCFENTRNIHLVMEYAGKMHLKRFIDQNIPLPCNLPLIILKQLVETIYYIHTMGIAHRDLKMENIVINEALDCPSVKLVDFGFSLKFKDDQICNDICGTPNYMCPELCRRGEYDPRAADVWALGVIFYFLLNNEFPFKGANEVELFTEVLTKEMIFQSESNSNETKLEDKLLQGMLQKDNLKRWSIAQVYENLILK